MDWKEMVRIRRDRSSGMSNGGWNYDAYPEIERLDAGKTITVAHIEGPAVITCIHMTRHFIYEKIDGFTPEWHSAMGARGIILEVYFDGAGLPSIKAPIGDFFADGCGGNARFFSTPFVEKAPESYNCFFPMPFRASAKVMLCNETDHDLYNYTFVEYETLDQWPEDTGYFHATWKRFAFQLDADTDRQFFHIDGCGHLIGRAWSICTAEPFFQYYYFIMEGNNEIRIDGEETPGIDYLGTEDSFGHSWGFNEEFTGLYNGINFLNKQPSMLSIYRFLQNNAIRFKRSLDIRIDWSHELRNTKNFEQVKYDMERNKEKGCGYVDYATTYYWYQDTPGYTHEPMIPLAERIKPVLITKGME